MTLEQRLAELLLQLYEAPGVKNCLAPKESLGSLARQIDAALEEAEKKGLIF